MAGLSKDRFNGLNFSVLA